MSCATASREFLGLEHPSQRVAQGLQSREVASGQLGREAAVSGSGEGAGQPAQVVQSLGRVLEQIQAVDQQQGELDVGGRLRGISEPVLREAARFNLQDSSLRHRSASVA